MKSTVKYTEAQLKKGIYNQVLDKKTLQYTMCKKTATNLSIFSNWRLLVFEEEDCILYYVNVGGDGYVAPPFDDIAQIPKPKNDIAFVPMCVVKNPLNTKELIVQFNKKNEKGVQTSAEWVF